MKERIFERLTVGDIETNCWICPLPGRDGLCAVIDPGDEAHRIIAFLREKNLVPAFILLTHGHFDHLAALPELAAAFAAENPKPVVAIHKDDSHYLGNGAYSHHRDCMIAAGGSESYVRALWKPMPAPDVLLSEGDTIGIFRVIHLPGHTRGSSAYYDEGSGVLYSGDTLFCGDYGRTDLPGGDAEKLGQSLKRLFALDESISVCPGHGPATTIGQEARTLVYFSEQD